MGRDGKSVGRRREVWFERESIHIQLFDANTLVRNEVRREVVERGRGGEGRGRGGAVWFKEVQGGVWSRKKK